MWHEKHAPRSQQETTWSPQKLRELNLLIKTILEDAERKRSSSPGSPTSLAPGGKILLFHGPSGSGKLSTFKALFGGGAGVGPDENEENANEAQTEAVPPKKTKRKTNNTKSQAQGATPSTTTAAISEDLQKKSFKIDTLFGVENTLSDLRTFLGDSISLMRNPQSVEEPTTSGRQPTFSSQKSTSQSQKVFNVDDDETESDAGEEFRNISGNDDGSHNKSKQRVDVHFRIVKELPHTWGTSQDETAASPAALQNALNQFVARFEAVMHEKSSPAGGSNTALLLPPPVVIVVFLHTIHDTHNDKQALRQAFPPQFFTSTAITIFKGSAVTTKALEKRMTAICKMENVQICTEDISNVASQSSGDIRQALLQLQWFCLTLPRLPKGAKHQIVSREKVKAAKVVAAGAKRKRVNVMDMLDDMFETSSQFQPPAAASLSKSASEDTTTMMQRENTAASSANGEEVEAQSTLPTTYRDQYVDTGHAAARVLTQKRTSVEVLSQLTAPSWKLMGYITHNMHHYFAPHQISELAMCYDEASKLEKWQPFAEQQPPQAASDLALHTFSAAYRTFHPHVEMPRTFLSLGAPTYHEQYFPVTRFVVDEDQADFIVKDRHQFALKSFSDHYASIFRSRNDLQQQQPSSSFGGGGGGSYGGSGRRDQGMAIHANVGLIRELVRPTTDGICSVKDLVTDFLPLGSQIVVPVHGGENGSRGLVGSAAGMTAPVAVPPPAPPPAAPNKPKRTLFVPPGMRTDPPAAPARPATRRISDAECGLYLEYAQKSSLKWGSTLQNYYRGGGGYGGAAPVQQQLAVDQSVFTVINSSNIGNSSSWGEQQRHQFGGGGSGQQSSVGGNSSGLPTGADNDPIEDVDD